VMPSRAYTYRNDDGGLSLSADFKRFFNAFLDRSAKPRRRSIGRAHKRGSQAPRLLPA